MTKTQTTADNGFSIEILKQLAFMQHEGESFFIVNNKAYIGEEDSAKESYDAANEDYESFNDFCSNECDEVEEFNNDDYLVLTDEEANEKVKEYIEGSLWAFNADFIIGECGLDFSGVDSLRKMQQDSCEDANDFIRSLIDKCTDIDSFVESAVRADGRGHFLSSYDGEENEETVCEFCEETGENETMFYIYRVN